MQFPTLHHLTKVHCLACPFFIKQEHFFSKLLLTNPKENDQLGNKKREKFLKLILIIARLCLGFYQKLI